VIILNDCLSLEFSRTDPLKLKYVSDEDSPQTITREKLFLLANEPVRINCEKITLIGENYLLLESNNARISGKDTNGILVFELCETSGTAEKSLRWFLGDSGGQLVGFWADSR
jgi:hypothetical protein